MLNLKKLTLNTAVALVALAPIAPVAGALPFHKKTPSVASAAAKPVKKKSFVRRHPVVTAVGAYAVYHHFHNKAKTTK